MRVQDCKHCEHCKRKTWSTYYKPNNYHAIGVTHAYAFCDRHKKRVLNIKKCDKVAEQ